MKKLTFFLVSLVALLVSSGAKAQEVSPYDVNFDTKIDVSDHAFKVAKGWSHLVGTASSGYDDLYVTYTYLAGYGVDSTNALMAQRQSVYDEDYNSYDLKDVLITPLVKGTVSIKLQRSWEYSSSWIEFYKMTKNADGTWEMGDLIRKDNSTISTMEQGWTTDTIGTFDEDTYIGIRASYMVMDDFHADNANIVLSKGLSISNLEGLHSSPDTQADGKFPLNIIVSLQNTGDVDLTAGMENYSLTVFSRDSNEVLGTVAINKDIAAGATAKDTILVYADYAKYPDQTAYKVKENLTGTTYAYQVWFDPIPYAPKLQVRDAKSNTVDSTSTINFGKISKATSVALTVRNTGAKELNVTSVDVPAGFSVSRSAFTVAPHADSTLVLTALNSTPGKYEGTVAINADELDPYTFNVASEVLDSTKYFINFEDNKIPAGALNNSDWAIAEWKYNGNNYVLQNSLLAESKFITPKLKVNEGETISFDCGKRSSSSFLAVYYSPDRVNWTPVDTIVADSMSSVNIGSGWYTTYDLSTFTLGGIPAGEWYIGFGAGYANLDNIYGFELVPVNHDLVLSNTSLPTAAEVNHAYTAKVTATNLLASAEDKGAYTAALYIGDEKVGIPSATLESQKDIAFDATITPHKAGKLPAYIKFTFTDGYEVSTDTVEVNVVAESASSRIQIGEIAKGNGQSPIYTNYCSSETETVYDLDLLKDKLPAGAKITGVTFKGYKQNDPDLTTTVKIWLQNTDESIGSTFSDTTNLTRVFTDTYTFTRWDDNANPTDMLSVTFSEPFVYTGSNLRMYARSEADKYKTVYFMCTDEQNHTIGHQNDDITRLASSTIYKKNTPVAFFDVEKDPAKYTGLVVNEQGETVSGAAVNLRSGDVLYTDTTDAEGKFTVTVMQDQLQYKAEVIAAGYQPSYTPVAFDGTADTITLKVATGLYIKAQTIPAETNVNSTFPADVTIIDDLTDSIAAADYTVALYVGDEKVDVATADLAPLADKVLSTSYTPHAAGTFPAYFKAVYGDNEYTSDTVQLVVAPEEFNGEATACDSMLLNNNYYQSPWNNNYAQSQGVVVYTPEQIHVPAGALIKRIRFRGSFLSTTVSGKEAYSFYIGNTDKSVTNYTEANEMLADTLSMMRLKSKDVDSIAYPGTEAGVHDLIDIAIPNGLTYDGGNLVIVFDGNHSYGLDNKTQFVAEHVTGGASMAWNRQIDNGDISSSAIFAQVEYMPVMYITYDNRKTLSGSVVTTAGEPIADAALTLKSGEVEYYATSAADGTYTMDIAKGKLSYDLSALKDGYVPSTKSGVNFLDSADVVLNDTLLRYVVANSVVKGKEMNPYKPESVVVLLGAKVVVTDAEGNTFAELTTADDGTFSVDSLVETKEYTFAVSADEYKDSTFAFTTPYADTTLEDIVLEKLVKEITATGKVLFKDVVDYKVTDPAPLANATVKVTDAAGAEIATLTTDADGSYSLTLTEAGTYTFTVSCDGYTSESGAADSTFTFTAGAEDATLQDVTLVTPAYTGIVTINSDSNKGLKGDVYSVSGQYIGRNVDLKTLRRGVYIINGKKVTVK